MRLVWGCVAACSMGLVVGSNPAWAAGRSPRDVDVGGIRLGMTLAQVRAALPKELRLEPMRSMDRTETAVVSAYRAHLRIAFFGGPSLQDPGRVVSISKDGPQTTCEAVVNAASEKYGAPYPVKLPPPGARGPIRTSIYGWFEEETTPPGRIPVVKCLQDPAMEEYGCLWDRDVLSMTLTERSAEPGLCTYHVWLHGGAYRAELEKGVQADAAVRQKQKLEELKRKASSKKPSL